MMRYNRLARSARNLIVRLGGASLALSFFAFGSAADEPTAPASLDAPTVAAWADETFNAALERHEFSGLTVSVVKDGELLFSRGYGRADFARPGEVDPVTTQFRIGSITKTFTATIIAQLIEEGAIGSIDDPANQYLRDYALPDNDGVAITLRHLLTHSAGFEDRFFFIGSDFPTPAQPSAEEFDRLRPAYVRPAGARVVYSNFGITVLGRIIEDVTGQPIEVAMQTRLFDPLGMTHTRLLVDILEPAGLGKPATIWPDGTHTATKFTAINPSIAPAGSIVSTADDMAQYMLAQLGHGPRLPNGEPVLSDAVRTRLHTPLLANSDASTDVAMTFFIEDWAGQRTVAHGGNWTGFHSWMTLIPDLNAGMFVSLMSEPPPATVGGTLRSLVMPWVKAPRSPAVISGGTYVNTFLNHFVGERRPLPSGQAESSDELAGWYRADRRPFSNAESIVDLLSLGAGTLRVASENDGLRIAGAGPWRAAGNGVFILDAPMRNQSVIRHDERLGAPVMIPDLGIYTFTRIPWYQHARLHAYIALAAWIACVIGGIAMLRSARHLSPVALGATGITALAALSLPFIAFFGESSGASMLTQLYAGHTQRMIVFIVVAHVLGLAALATLWQGMRTRSTRWPLVTGVAGLVLTGVLAVYNILGWQIPGA